MVIWFTSGLPLTAWLKPVMLFALPQFAVITVLSLFISPWAAQMGEQYQSRIKARNDVTRVNPGVFGETGNKERVFFVESVSGDSSTVQNVFVASVQLENGRRYEGTPGDPEYRVTEFDRYAARIETTEASQPQQLTHKTQPTWGLIVNPTSPNLGELLWRIGVPISAMVLVFLAIPMSFVNPRAGRSVNLMFALATYIVYSNLLSVSQARVAQGRMDFSVGWWIVHALMVLLLVFMFARRMQLIRLRLGR
jgi:lipopolysaccharide export system permease protein